MYVFIILLCLAQASALVAAKPWMVRDMSPEDRARALLGVMTLEEKIAMLHGYNSPNYTGLTLGNARLSIPPLNMNDGRQGFRPNNGNNKQSSFPCELSTVATFDKQLYYQFGEAMGEEFAGKGGNVMLAPMLILARVPQGGRNFESTGECPELAYHFAKNMITGVQSVPGVIANADDFVLSTFCRAPSLPPPLFLRHNGPSPFTIHLTPNNKQTTRRLTAPVSLPGLTRGPCLSSTTEDTRGPLMQTWAPLCAGGFIFSRSVCAPSFHHRTCAHTTPLPPQTTLTQLQPGELNLRV